MQKYNTMQWLALALKHITRGKGKICKKYFPGDYTDARIHAKLYGFYWLGKVSTNSWILFVPNKAKRGYDFIPFLEVTNEKVKPITEFLIKKVGN